MTLKNAAAGLPHGGGKSVLYGNPRMPEAKKERLIRTLASALRNEETYIFGPDMGTDEVCMAWIKDEIGRAVGLPREMGGIPLDEIGATGWGLSHAVSVALEHCEFEVNGARLVVQGFGAVGMHASRFLAEKGAILVGVSDSAGAIHNADGLEIESLVELKRAGGCVTDFGDAAKMDRDAIIDIECDIWIPAARPDVITEENVHRLNTRLVAQGANIPLTHGAEKVLHERGILNIPDFIANAGGVICAAMEYRGASQSAVFQVIEEKLKRNTSLVMDAVASDNVPPREAAMALAVERVKRAMSFRRHSLFSSAPGHT